MDAALTTPPPPPPSPPMTKTTTTAATSSKSVLDKPLHELTEEDISLVTREDCRRYLQERGMRRPSWNKSQAIQQVISLKSLLDSPPPPSLPAKRPAPAPPEVQHHVSVDDEKSNSCGSGKEFSTAEAEVSVSATEPVRGQECKKLAVDDKATTSRSFESTDLPLGEMTIFYSGKVNAYEQVPAEQAQTILHLAASSFQFSQDEQTSGSSPRWATPMQLHSSNTKCSVTHPRLSLSSSILTGNMAECVPQLRREENLFRESDADGQSNRQVSLQKYREKKKDRGRFKNIDKVGPPGLDVCLNHHTRTNIVDGQSSGSNTSFPNQTGHPYRLTDLAENSKHPKLSVDINGKV